VAEALTLAQVVRLVALARNVRRDRYEVHFACGAFDEVAFAGSGLKPLPLFTIDRARALARIDRGERLYEASTLERYVEEEIELLDRVRPDLVVGDFRLSLAVSTRLRRVPYASLINAYFSPFAVRHSFPVPDHPLVSLLGVKRAAQYWPKALPLAFAHFIAPIDSVRKRYGIEPTGGLLEAFVDADFTLYPDVPELCPTRDLPATHEYLGPIGWSPPLPLPKLELGPDRPLVYVTLGSSGRHAGLRAVLGVIGDFPVDAVVATAGRFEVERPPSNVHVVGFAPGAELCRRSSFVVTNGGASTSYQALAEGRPVLGVPSNLDQYLAMTAIERAGAGRLVRSGEATPRAMAEALTELLTSSTLREGARAVAQAFARADCHQRFDGFLARILPSQGKESNHERAPA
jgi:UDP:flavonoid glycosyltransferase YjiC (YdhE family)